MNEYLKDMIKVTPSWVVHELKSISSNDDQLLGLLEDFIERAGIMEFDGHLSRFQAEKQALELVKESREE